MDSFKMKGQCPSYLIIANEPVVDGAIKLQELISGQLQVVRARNKNANQTQS